MFLGGKDQRGGGPFDVGWEAKIKGVEAPLMLLGGKDQRDGGTFDLNKPCKKGRRSSDNSSKISSLLGVPLNLVVKERMVKQAFFVAFLAVFLAADFFAVFGFLTAGFLATFVSSSCSHYPP